MAPKKQQHVESESEGSDQDVPAGAMDFSRFTNPNFSREFMAKLPAKVRDRTKLLLQMDEEYVKRCNTRESVRDDIRRKYEEQYAKLFERRAEIVSGDSEATDAEVAAGFPEDHKDKVSLTDDGKPAEKGIGNFWLEALQHHVIIAEIITERDEAVLAHLIDVRAATLDPSVRPGFTVVLKFEPNEHFKNTTLSKTFYWKHECGELTIGGTDETAIEWNEGKDTTVTTVSVKQKSNKKKGAVRYVTRTEPCDSFFNLFKHTEDAEENEQWCSLSVTLRDKISPFAVEYYTGEAPDGSSDVEDDEEGEEDEEEEDEEEEEEVPRARGRGGAVAPANRGGKGAGQQDCKQQ